jgi:hypothetical protein
MYWRTPVRQSVASAVVEGAACPTLAVLAEKRQQQIEHPNGFAGVALGHDGRLLFGESALSV